jgi:hypothetical protein
MVLRLVGPSAVSTMGVRTKLGVLLFVGVLLRAGLCLTYAPVPYPDTPSYFRLAVAVWTGDFSTYDGRRPPGYPVVIALANGSPHGVWALQLLAGLGISVLLFAITLAITGRPWVATAVGLSYDVNLAQLFFEATLLAETIGTLLVVGAVATLLLSRHALREPGPVIWRVAGTGVLAGAAVLTKPQFVFLPLLIGALVAAAPTQRVRWRTRLGRAALATLPGVLLILVWCTVNHAKTGSFTLSTQLGIGLMNQSLAFVELAPDRYRTIRDVYVRYRDAKLARTGLHTANWDAVPELLTITGLSLPALSKELTALSLNLFVHQPLRYAKGVALAWVDFWMVPNYWQPARLAPSWLVRPLALLWRLEHLVLRAVNVTFLVVCALAVISRRFRARVGFEWSLASISAVVIATSIVQALGEYGENARYAVSVQALVVLVVALAASRWRAGVQVISAARPRVVAQPSQRGVA